MAVTKNLVAVKGPQVAVVLGWSGSEGLLGSGNPDPESGSEMTQKSREYFTFAQCAPFLVFACGAVAQKMTQVPSGPALVTPGDTDT